MARQVLENGVILPAEYSDDWYDDMTSNLTKLDDVIGSDSEKLSSADVGAAALSNSYNDLDNLPTIPTKTSDLTNDSNFVDTSNSAVASGITSAKVTSYDSHVADTDIHVTTADKTKWNNGVSQSYVFRYSSTALVASSTNSNTLLDNTDNLKVGDKVIDSSGVLFSITAIDSVNSTFTVGSALIDLAKDSDVVHTSGNETIGGNKTFSDNIIRGTTNTNSTIQSRNLIGNTTVSTTGSNSSSYQSISATLNYSDSTPSKSISVNLYVNENAYADGKYNAFYPGSNNVVNLGISGKRWANVYATNYYYGSSEVEFSTKFVTTDTNQNIIGRKTFIDNTYLYNSDETGVTPYLVLKSSKAIKGDTTGSNTDQHRITHVDKSNNQLSYIQFRKLSNGGSDIILYCATLDTNNQNTDSAISFFKSVNGSSDLIPIKDNDVNLGNSTYKWKDVNTYLVNGLTPSSLGMPSDTYVDISGYVTDLTGGYNQYTAPDNGIVAVDISGTNGYVLYNNTLSIGDRQTGSNFRRAAIIQVRKNDSIIIQSNGGTLNYAKFYPCLGNV